MPPRISWSTFSPARGSTFQHHHSQCGAIKLSGDGVRQRQKQPIGVLANSAANFTTAPAKRLGLNQGMPAQERIEARRKEQLDADTKALERNLTRDWRPGDIYAPHDLSGAEARKWKKRQNPTTDAFDALSLNPLDCYKNFSIMSEYTTDMGRIKHSRETGLRNVNQRKIAKAIRRAVGIGLIPSVHRHPELLKRAILTTRQTGKY